MNLPQQFFIAGTDTDVGKTYVSLELIRSLVKKGERVGVMKPVSAGCEWVQGEWKNGDALALMEASNLQQQYAEVNPYAYEQPVSPHIAAKISGRAIDLELIFEAFQKIKSTSDSVLIEGAGGWLTPISESQSMADITRKLNVPVILVVGIKLGCLNHAQLTARSIKEAGVSLAGWVANELDPEMSYLKDNLEMLEGQIDAPLITQVPYRKH
jgi:dethiobiotin synthetase